MGKEKTDQEHQRNTPGVTERAQARVSAFIKWLNVNLQRPEVTDQIAITRPFPAFGSSVVRELASSRLSDQLNQMSALDDKIATLFSTGQGLIGIAAAFLALAGPPPVAVTLLIVATAIWINLSLYSIVGYTLRVWQIGPNLSEAWANAREFEDDALNWWAAESFTNCYFHNCTPVKDKIFCARWAMIFLGTETLIIVVALTISAAS